jgi:acetylornithine deacetylase/succinyl-diaminopimelate desuccinylase-like protein
VASVQAGTKSNVIPNHATIPLNIRTYKEGTPVLDPGRDQADRDRSMDGVPVAPTAGV